MIRTNISSLLSSINTFRENNIPYLDISTGGNHIVTSENVKYASHDNSFPTDQLYFIGLVKKRILEGHPNKKEIMRGVDASAIRYFDFGKQIKNGQTIKDCIEVDINHAYWSAAYKLNILPKEIYERGLNGMAWDEALTKKIINKKQFADVQGLSRQEALDHNIITDMQFKKMAPISKIIRLASIGSLAKVTRVTYFSGKRTHLLFRKRDDCAYMWDAICHHIHMIVKDCIEYIGKENFIFFWVDAIVVKKGVEQKLIDYLKTKQFGSKTVAISKIVVKNHKMMVHSLSKEKEPIRIFHLTKPTKRRK